MSTPDTMTTLVSAPWFDAAGHPLPITPLPGLRPEAIQGLAGAHPGIVKHALRELLATCCGLEGTALGSIDFTGRWFPDEPCAVLRPSLTLAIDDEGRRWIAETSGEALPGPVWCVFPDPEVAVYASDDVAAFIDTLRELTRQDQTLDWLKDFTAQAKLIWSQRHQLALRPHEAHQTDQAIRGWLLGLPYDAYVYDLRMPSSARGWPYGVVGPSGRYYRCGHLPVFAVAGSPGEGWKERRPDMVHPKQPRTKRRWERIDIGALRDGGRSRSSRSIGARSSSGAPLYSHRLNRRDLPSCA
jgi:hypothetical protein